jgi:hypothetical protein
MYTVDDLVSHLDSEFIEPILSLLNILLTLDMVLFLDRVRSNQPIGQTHTRTQSNKNLKIDFFEFIYFYLFLIFISLLTWATTRSVAWGVFNCFSSPEQIKILIDVC